MTQRSIVLLAISMLAMSSAALRAEPPQDGVASFVPGVTTGSDPERGRSLTVGLADERAQIRPDVSKLPVPLGYTRAQLELGDRVFHGEAARGQCSVCHGIDAAGTQTGNDLTTGMFIWADGTVGGLKRILAHNMAVVPGMDGDLKPADVDAVAAYVWALGRQTRQEAD